MLVQVTVFLSFVFLSVDLVAQVAFEEFPVLEAGEVVPPSLQKGPGHEVAAQVEMWITGTASEKMQSGLAALGGSLNEEVFPTKAAPLNKIETSAAPAQETAEEGVGFGGKYKDLKPRQRRLVDRWFEEFNRITGENRDPRTYYNQVPLSARTTFEAVTHALTQTQLTTTDGRLLGRAIDLVDMVEAFRGRVPGTRGDEQFRIYVVLKQGAPDLLEESVEFSRGHDNTVYHKDYPISYRLNGTPSIQFSITRTLERADIDVDYRSSSFPKVLFNGHLTAGNSDVRAGNNYQGHLGRWEGFTNWWSHLFGLIIPSNTPAKFETKVNIPVKPAVSGDESLDNAVHDFLRTWLVEQKPADSVPYFSTEAYDCILELHGRKEGVDNRLASFRLLHEMQLTNHLLGKPKELEQVIRPVYSSNRELVITPHSLSQYFSSYALPAEAVDSYACPPPEGYREVKLSEQGGEAFGIFAELLGPHAESEELVTVWKKESGYWKIVSIHLGPDIHHAELPDHRETVAAMNSPIHRAPNSEVPGAVQSFLTSWFVERDYEGAQAYFSRHCLDCTNTLLGEEEPPNTNPVEASNHLRRSLREIAEAVAQSSSLADMIAGVESWHPEVYVVDHPARGAYLLADIPDDVAKPLACWVRTPNAKVHEELPPHEEDVYVSAFHLKIPLEDPPILFLLWAKEAGQWKIVSYHVEMH